VAGRPALESLKQRVGARVPVRVPPRKRADVRLQQLTGAIVDEAAVGELVLDRRHRLRHAPQHREGVRQVDRPRGARLGVEGAVTGGHEMPEAGFVDHHLLGHPELVQDRHPVGLRGRLGQRPP
jgi:hypothetical protein